MELGRVLELKAVLSVFGTKKGVEAAYRYPPAGWPDCFF